MTPLPPFGAALCIGGAVLDLVGRASASLSPGGSNPGAVRAAPGGVAFNIAKGLARRGVSVTLAGAQGDDEGGRRIEAALAAEGVRAQRLRSGGATDRYLAIEAPDGELTLGLADLSGLENVAGPAIAAALSHAPDGPVIVDGNLLEAQIEQVLAHAAPGRPVILVAVSTAKAPRLAPFAADVAGLFCNRAEAEAILRRPCPTAAAAARALAALGPVCVGVTHGGAPAALALREEIAEAAPPARQGGSTNGLGDAFTAGALAAIGGGAAAEAALTAGVSAAAETGERQ